MILVTGATGNVGKELVPQLLEAGQDVRVLVRDPEQVEHLDPRVERATGDLDQRETLQRAMRGVRAVYLIAFEDHQVENVIEAASASGVERIVRQSTIEAGACPPLGPGRWHRAQELLVEKSGLGWTHLRPTMMMVNTIQWWGATVRARDTVFFPGGDGGVSPVDPKDVAAVACAVLTRPGHDASAYEVTGPEVLTVGQMVEALSCALGRPIRYVDIPESAAAEWLRQQGAPGPLAAALVETMHALRISQYAYVADTVERLTGQKGRTFATWCHGHAGAFQ